MTNDTTHNSSSPIFIIGYMACGKTTFGRALGRASGREFIDLDFRIEQRFHTTVSEIFRTRGESGFRKIESEMLREVAEMENVIVACGGGTPCFNDNMGLMLASGHTVWLDSSIERIVRRLIANRSKRPLMADKRPEELTEAVSKGMEPRIPYYSRARIRISGDRLEYRNQISDTVESFISMHPEIFLAETELNS